MNLIEAAVANHYCYTCRSDKGRYCMTGDGKELPLSRTHKQRIAAANKASQPELYPDKGTIVHEVVVGTNVPFTPTGDFKGDAVDPEAVGDVFDLRRDADLLNGESDATAAKYFWLLDVCNGMVKGEHDRELLLVVARHLGSLDPTEGEWLKMKRTMVVGTKLARHILGDDDKFYEHLADFMIKEGIRP